MLTRILVVLAVWCLRRPLCAAEDIISLQEHRASISVQVNTGLVVVNVTGDSNIPEVAAEFCARQGIEHLRCPHFVSVDLWDALWCEPGQKARARGILERQLLEQAPSAANQLNQLDDNDDSVISARIPRVYRFLHHENFLDSEEFSLLRPRLQQNGYVECASGLTLTGEEDAVWLLGHLSSEQLDDTNWPYGVLMKRGAPASPSASSASSSPSVFSINAFPNAGHLGNKDEMLLNLVALGHEHSGDAATNFLPRTWSPEQLSTEVGEAAAAAQQAKRPRPAAAAAADTGASSSTNSSRSSSSREWRGHQHRPIELALVADAKGGVGDNGGDEDGAGDDTLVGLWFQKDPQKELGSGISVVEAVKPVELVRSCKACVLQRYVDNPFLLDGDKKFSLGVYTAFTGTEPLGVWLHREMLVLVCTKPFKHGQGNGGEGNGGEGNGGEGNGGGEGQDRTLSHLSNGLLNRRLNPGDQPECEGCPYNATDQVWTTDRFLAHLKARGVAWQPIEAQIRRIVLTAFTSTHEKFVQDVRGRVNDDPQFGRQLFSHWRFDFLLDNGDITSSSHHGRRRRRQAPPLKPRAWLLETEIVPSTGTIGGVDEVIKQVVLRDLLNLVGWGGLPARQQTGQTPTNASSSSGLKLEEALCGSLPLGGWARKLCDGKLLFKDQDKDNSWAPTTDDDDDDNDDEGDDGEGTLRGLPPLPPLTRRPQQQLEAWVKRVLRLAGDSLWLDAQSVGVLARHELMSRRRLGYEPLSPVASSVFLANLPATVTLPSSSSLGGGRRRGGGSDGGSGSSGQEDAAAAGGGGGLRGIDLGYVAFDGTPFHWSPNNSGEDEVASAERLFLGTKALSSDVAVWRFEAAKAKLRHRAPFRARRSSSRRKDQEQEEVGKQKPHRSVKSSEEAVQECRACLARQHPFPPPTRDDGDDATTSVAPFFYYCASVAGVQSRHGHGYESDDDAMLVFQGACLPPWELCRDRFKGFVDGVPLVYSQSSGEGGGRDDSACTALDPNPTLPPATRPLPPAAEAAAEAAVASLKTRTRVLHLMGSDSVAHFHFLWRTKIHSLLRFRKLLDTNFCIPMTAAAAAAETAGLLLRTRVDDGGSVGGESAAAGEVGSADNSSTSAAAASAAAFLSSVSPVAVLHVCGQETAAAVRNYTVAAAASNNPFKGAREEPDGGSGGGSSSSSSGGGVGVHSGGGGGGSGSKETTSPPPPPASTREGVIMPRRPAEVSRREYLSSGGLPWLIRGDVPVVIRGGGGGGASDDGGRGEGRASSSTHAPAAAAAAAGLSASASSPSEPPPSWFSAESLTRRFGDVAGVTALVYDQSLDSAQPLNTAAGLEFRQFVEWAKDPSLFLLSVVEPAATGAATSGEHEGVTSSPSSSSSSSSSSSPSVPSLVPYLLLTTRHQFEEGAGGATDPNSALADSFGDLLTKDVPAAFAPDYESREGNGDDCTNDVEDERRGCRGDGSGDSGGGGGGWFEAWTSLRLGGRYAYPTHIDCFENMILQLSGNKTVRLLPPRAVASVRPDPLRKHWPGAPEAELERWRRTEEWWECLLAPGDQLFVPIMWFHSVEVSGGDDWSATANRYFLKAEPPTTTQPLPPRFVASSSSFPPLLGSRAGGAASTAAAGPVWRAHVERKKHTAWRSYEEATGAVLC